MGIYEVRPDLPVMPSVHFMYGHNGEVIGELTPLTSPVEQAFINGTISPEEYKVLAAKEVAANQELCEFMYGEQPPYFMPKVRRFSRVRDWLRIIL